jgi:sugar/nucleoside kinase (ribokinase family)
MLGDCDAVVAGHICLDVIPDLAGIAPGKFETVFLPSRLVDVGPATLSTGGAVSNTGLALSRLGIETRLIGKVGDDLFGQAIKQIVTAHGPDLAAGMVADETASTSYTVVISPPGVDRIFLHCPGANDTFGAADVGHEAVAETRLFHFGYPPLMQRMFEDDGTELTEMFRRVKTLGVTTSLDLAVPDPISAAGRANWRAILQATLPHVDICLPSVEEILYMLRRETYERFRATGDLPAQVTPPLLSDLSRELLAMGARIVGFKLGHRGLYLHTAGQSAIEALGTARPSNPSAWTGKELWAPCFRVDVVGATGAGDATIAGFLAALLRDLSPEEALTAAVAVGACNVEAADALSGVRPWEETWRRVESGWARHHLDLESPGWRFDDACHLWVKTGAGA